MVKSRKASKFIIDLGPEIDKVVKKKNAKIRKQRVIIAELEDRLRNKSDDMKARKQKLVIASLQERIVEAEKRTVAAENETRRYKVRRAGISNKTVENAFKNLREGKSLSRMKANTILLIQQSGRWDEARKISAQRKLC
jgi:predicted  nucleic acid-binding Zn-ribbon protein